MKQAAFIDHSFKSRSGSSQFFINVLKENYRVDTFWDDSWKKQPGVDLELIGKNNYDLVVFFQVHNVNRSILGKHNIRNAVFVPMYDASYGVKKTAWQDLAPYKFINFSRTLHDQLKKLGLNSLNVRYFCPPGENVVFEKHKTLKGFFWQRYDRVNWNHISSIIKHAPFDRIHIHKAMDPQGFEFYPPSEDEMRKYAITFSEWSAGRDQYLEAIKQSDVFFAPRKFEGIGMSFLEAMAMGKCVVAPNFPTMNEYIVNGKNGLLYDLEKLTPLNFDHIGDISRNAYESMKTGHAQWKHDRQEILRFCEQPTLYWPGNKKLRTVQKSINRIKIIINDARLNLNIKHPGIARTLIRMLKGLRLID
jgi:hypothetical protein